MSKHSKAAKIISIALVIVSVFSTLAITVSAATYSTGTYAVASSNGINVRAGAGTGYSKVGAAAKGVNFTVSKVSGSWGYTSSIRCTNGAKAGWVLLDNCSKKSSGTSASKYSTGTYAVSSSSGINVRTGAGTGYSAVGAAAKGVNFTVSKVSGSWGYTSSIRCTNGAKAGWVALDYCTFISSSSTYAQSSAKIKLNVPLYKQSDSRWKNVYIGSKTIGAVGCTTTAIAMVYSYNTGKTVYPNEVKKKLSYSNNDLYWSSISNVGLTSVRYKSSLTNSMLSTIYNQLRAGRPVVIGAQTSSGGSQHWVVITGYTGSSTTSFSPANFLVNDPGSQGSTTLSAFLANGSKADRTEIIRIIY